MTAEELERLYIDLTSHRRGRSERAREILLDVAAARGHVELVLPRIRKLLVDESPAARGTGYLALVEALGADSVQTLLSHLDEPDVGARHDLVTAAAGLGAEGKPLLIRLARDDVFEVRFLAAAELADLGEKEAVDIVPALIEGIGWGRTRFQALSSLYRLADRRALEPGKKLFAKYFISGFERVAAAGLLAKLGDDEARQWLQRRLEKRRGDDRGLAIELVGDLRLAGATETLIKTLQEKKDVFRGAAARALGMLNLAKDDGVRELLEKILADESEDPDVRMDSAEGLLHMGTPAAKRALESAQTSVKNEDVRAVVKEALEALALESSSQGQKL